MVQKIWCFVAVGIMLCSFQSNSLAETQAKGETTMTINMTSTAFEEGGMIPKQYTCDGKVLFGLASRKFQITNVK